MTTSRDSTAGNYNLVLFIGVAEESFTLTISSGEGGGKSTGSSGGCDAGFGVGALVLAIALTSATRKKRD